MIIAVINNKGGVGKTTTTVHVGYALHKQGKRVLCVDMDGQANLLMHLFPLDMVYDLKDAAKVGASQSLIVQSKLKRSSKQSSEQATERATEKSEEKSEEQSAEQATKQVGVEVWHHDSGIDVLPLSFHTFTQEHYTVAIQRFASAYDVVLLDCPPSLETRTLAALDAAESVLIPTEAESLSFNGLTNLIEMAQERNLAIVGIVVTRFEKKKAAHNFYLPLIAKEFRSLFSGAVIGNSAVFPSASAMQRTGYEWNGKKANAALDEYTKLALRISAML
jgi:chromosome partitioning protein